jgi:HEAT repeat protein
MGSLSSVDAEGVRTLGTLLGDSEATVRKASLDALRRHAVGATRLLPDIAALLSDRDLDVRRLAAEALGAMGPAAESAAPRLLEVAKDPSENANVRFSAVQALQAILRKPKGE